MRMHTGNASASDEPELMTEINTTPLIDVMLVLLVMLIITIPIQLHSVDLDIPVSVPPTNLAQPDKIRIDIDAQSVVHWQGQPVNSAELDEKMTAIAPRQPQPELHIRPDKNAQYAVFAHVLASSKRLGLNKIAVLGTEQFVQ